MLHTHERSMVQFAFGLTVPCAVPKAELTEPSP